MVQQLSWKPWPGTAFCAGGLGQIQSQSRWEQVMLGNLVLYWTGDFSSIQAAGLMSFSQTSKRGELILRRHEDLYPALRSEGTIVLCRVAEELEECGWTEKRQYRVGRDEFYIWGSSLSCPLDRTVIFLCSPIPRTARASSFLPFLSCPDGTMVNKLGWEKAGRLTSWTCCSF